MMSEPAQHSEEDGDTGDSLQEFFVITPACGSLKWLPIKGDRLTISLEREPPRDKEKDCGAGIGGENSK
jgi:hypothetical protein